MNLNPRVPILPAKDPNPILSRNGMGLKAWPRHPDGAVRWPTLPIREALVTRWPCDAMALQYTDLGSEDGRCWRYSMEVLGIPAGEDVYLAVVFCDLDTEPHVAWESKEASDRALRALRAELPIGWYSTLKGMRGVGICPEIVPLRLARDYLRTWHTEQSTRLAGLLREHGLHWDLSAAEWTRPFRLPYVTRTEKPSDLVDGPNGPEWHGWKTWEPHSSGFQITVETDVLDLIDTPSPEKVQSAPDHIIRLHSTPRPATSTPPEGWRAWISDASKAGIRAAGISAGEPWGPPLVPHGERNNELKSTLNSLACQLWRHQPERPTTEDLYGILAPCVEAELRRDRDAPSLDDLWRLASFAATLERDRRERDAPPDLSADGGYPPIVAHGDGVAFILNQFTGKYTGPFKGTDLYLELAENVQIPLKRASGTTMRPISEILSTHAVRAGRVELCYPDQGRGDMWDPADRVLRVELFEDPHNIPAVEHPEVGEWLRCLTSGSPQVADAFELWLATACYLRHPTAALYLEGPPGCGKGMLANALAMLWRKSPISLKETLSRFNFGLGQSPVVFGDEEQEFGKAESGAFRSYIAETAHRIEGKNRDIYTLYGSPRLILAANNPNLIKIQGSHGSKDLAALIDRILHIDASNGEAKRYLDALGGKPYTHDWVINGRGNPGRIAEHIAYLHEKRGADYVKAGKWGRFLVKGIRTDYHTKLITSDPLYGQVLMAVASSLASTNYIGIVCTGDGSVYVNPKILHEKWRILVDEDGFRPSLQQVAGALEAMSGVAAEDLPVGAGQASHWKIPGSLVVRAATDVGHAGVPRIRAALSGGTVPSDTRRASRSSMFGKDRSRDA